MSTNRLPGTRIEELPSTISPNPSSTQRIPCFIGEASPYIKVTYEEVIRSSTGLADDLEYSDEGIHSVLYVESQRGLKDFVAGTDYNLTSDQIVWTSSGVITAGATYYVTYYYDRPLTDYVYKEFTEFKDVTDDLGDDDPDHPLVMISKLALRYYKVPTIAVVQVPTNATASDYSDALELTKYRDVQSIALLNSTSQVRELGVAHVLERSLPDNKRERIFYTGAPVGTVVGTSNNPASLRGMAEGIAQERVVFVNATRAKYYYTDSNKVQQSTVVDGAFIAAAVAAFRDSFVHPTTTLLNRNLLGLELYAEDFEDYYSDQQLINCGASSLFLMAPQGGFTKILDDMTTDNLSVEKNNINIITAKDYIVKDVRYQMDRVFRGSLIKNRPHYQNVVLTFLKALFRSYLGSNIIEQIGTLSVTLPTDRRDTVNIYFSYYCVYTHKFTDGTFTIEV